MKPRIYIALDDLSKTTAFSLIKKLSKSKNAGLIAGYKIHDLWDSYGPRIVKELKDAGAREVWVDIKLNDTPKSVGLRAAAVSAAGADMLSVHAASGLSALRAAVREKIKIAAITVLTSLDHSEVREIFSTSAGTTTLRLAHIADRAGVWGIVCSAEEIKNLSRAMGPKVRYIVPGIRLSLAKESNQKRVGTPESAVRDGAHYIVVGSLVTLTPNPKRAFERVAEEILRGQS